MGQKDGSAGLRLGESLVTAPHEGMRQRLKATNPTHHDRRSNLALSNLRHSSFRSAFQHAGVRQPPHHSLQGFPLARAVHHREARRLSNCVWNCRGGEKAAFAFVGALILISHGAEWDFAFPCHVMPIQSRPSSKQRLCPPSNIVSTTINPICTHWTQKPSFCPDL